MYAFSDPTGYTQGVVTARFSNTGGAQHQNRRLDGGAATHVGLVRMRNEDAWTARPDAGVFVVCDGMGGHAAGDVASQIAVETIETLSAEITPVDPDPSNGLANALWRANMDIFLAARDPHLVGMGTTAVAIWIGGDRGVVAHVGDSRLYRLRDDEMELLTLDHSHIGDAVRAGRLDRETADALPTEPIITRSLGASFEVDVECAEFDVRPGDRYLLCTDGLSDVVARAEIQHVLENQITPGDAAGTLVRAALDRGGYDNVTTLVVDVKMGS